MKVGVALSGGGMKGIAHAGALKALEEAGIEVLFDDRKVSAGVKLTDSELMGMPIRVVISPKTMANGVAEVTMRESHETNFIPLHDLLSELKAIIQDEIDEIEK